MQPNCGVTAVRLLQEVVGDLEPTIQNSGAIKSSQNISVYSEVDLLKPIHLHSAETTHSDCIIDG